MQTLEKKKIIILGAGFAGIFTAINLSRRFKKDPTLKFTMMKQVSPLQAIY